MDTGVEHTATRRRAKQKRNDLAHHLPDMQDREQVVADTGLADRGRSRQQRLGSTINVSQPERAASAVAGASLLALCLKQRSLGGALLGLAGTALLYRGVSGHCHAYQALGVNTASADQQSDSGAGQAAGVQRSITIGKSADELYRFWREPQNLQRIMAHFADVTARNDTQTHWAVHTPFGGALEWDSEIVEERPGAAIRWRSLPAAAIRSEGWLEFRPAPGDRGTIATLHMRFQPPLGVIGGAVMKALKLIPGTVSLVALQRFKALVEAGEIPTTQGSSSARFKDRPDSRVYVDGAKQAYGQDPLARFLGWFSIGLGTAEIAAPRALAKLTGVPHRPFLLRLLGLREIMSGVGILRKDEPAPWLWSRVAGDAMDLALLGAALSSPQSSKPKVAAATVAVLGVTALDALSSRQHTHQSADRWSRRKAA